jgi:DNA-binding MarR family transcriptional regulator
VTGILHRLTSRRLLARQKDSADSRRVRLRLKPPAERLTRASNGTVERAVADMLSRLQPSLVAHAHEVLDALAESLEALNEQSTKRHERSHPRRTTKRVKHLHGSR